MSSPFDGLSVIVITKNAEKDIEKCLSSVAWVNNKIVVDSGSEDKTCEIAKKCGAKVIHQDWLGFGPQKQFAIEQAPTDWVLCLDADEYLSKNLSDELQSLIQARKFAYDAYRIPRSNKFMGRFLRHGEGYPDWSLRLFNRRTAKWSNDLVHEKVIGIRRDLSVGSLHSDLMHNSAESISQYIRKQNVYTDIQALEIIKRGKTIHLRHLIINPLVRFLKYYFLKMGCLDGAAGFIHIAIGCIFVFIKYAKAMALQHQNV